MINMPAVLIANGAAILLLAVVLLSRKSIIRFGLFDEKLFGAMAWFNIAMCVSETFSFAVEKISAPFGRAASIFFNTSNYVIALLFTMTWLLYIEMKLFEDEKRTRRKHMLNAIPATFVLCVLIANLFTPLIFSVSADNVYKRETFSPLIYLTVYGYIVYGMIEVYLNRKRSKRYLFLPMIVFLIPVLIASALQIAFYGISLIWLGTAISIVSLYINIQNQTTYIDGLSGVFNRQYLIYYIDAWAVKPPYGECMAGYMIDIDDFKSINDRFGHCAGDGVISDVGDMLRRVSGKNGFAARYGGDEFVVIQRYSRNDGAISEKTNSFISSIVSLPATPERPYEISLSIGVCLFENGDTTDTFINKMDKAMYAVKNKRIQDKVIANRRHGA